MKLTDSMHPHILVPVTLKVGTLTMTQEIKFCCISLMKNVNLFSWTITLFFQWVCKILSFL